MLALVVTAEALPQLTRAILGAGGDGLRALGDDELVALVSALAAPNR